MIFESENLVIEKINQHIFFKELKEYGFDNNILTKMFEYDKIESSDKLFFNSVIRNVCNKTKISLLDAMIYLEKYFGDYKKIINVFEINMADKVKKQLAKNYKIKQEVYGDIFE